MLTSPDSPPIGSHAEDTEQQKRKIESTKFQSHKSKPTIDKAVENIKSITRNAAETGSPKVIFLDETENSKANNKGERKAIEVEREHIEREQSNTISIIPAAQQNTQETSPEKTLSKHHDQSNLNKTPSKQKNQQHAKNTLETMTTYSIASGTNSREYHTTPVYLGNDEI